MLPLILFAGIAGVLFGAYLGASYMQRAQAASFSPPQNRRAGDSMHRESTQEALLAAFRPEEVPEPEDVLLHDQRILSDALKEIRHRRGAVSVVLWVLDQFQGGKAVAVAWSSASGDDDTRDPSIGLDAASRAVIEWSANERQLGFDASAGAPRLAVAPFDANGEPGAISLHFDDGALVTRDAARDWLPAHASMVATWYDLVRTRSDVARQNFRLRGLIRTASTLQAMRDPLELERTLVEDSLQVVGAQWAVLVRWDASAAEGVIRAVAGTAGALGIEESFPVRPGAFAGVACVEGRPQVLADAGVLVRGAEQIFGSGSKLGRVGALVAVPLMRGEHEAALGALVCGHAEAHALRANESRNAKNLAVIAAGALETAWTVEDARRNARTDALTGLANRRGFEERFGQVISETDRYGGSAAVVMVDLDHFKLVNDTYGHDAGDRVLRAVAELLADGRRTVDMAARLGGEELVVLLPQTDSRGALELAERLRQRIEARRILTSAGEVRVTASFGISEYRAREGQAQEVLDRADKALYAAKRNGRNRVERFTIDLPRAEG